MFLSRFFGRRDVRSIRPRLRCRVEVETLEGRQLLTIFTVTNVNDSGTGSLRQAILSSNASTDTSTNTIDFAIGKAGVTETITPKSSLPEVTHPVVVDGTSEPGTGTRLEIVLNGSGAGLNVSGLAFNGQAPDSTLKGLSIVGFSSDGILLDGTNGVTITNDYIGLMGDGVTYDRNDGDGITLTDKAHNNTISLNTISQNKGDGVDVKNGSDFNVIQGNRLGTDYTGTKDLGNLGYGVLINDSASNTIGGTTTAARNIIAENEIDGVDILNGSTKNVVEGNYIGTDASGEKNLGNDGMGVLIDSSNDNTVGGTALGAGNTISGNGEVGVKITNTAVSQGGVNGNVVAGNFIGTDAHGNYVKSLGNVHDGVVVDYGSDGNIIGGTTAAARNIISGNGTEGVVLSTGETGVAVNSNIVEGNFIGTNVNGTVAVPNGLAGVYISGSYDNTVEGNLISGNAGNGVYLTGSVINNISYTSKSNVVEGNDIGTNASGTAALGNGNSGVLISNNSANNVIGGTVAGAGNVISGNGGDGIYIFGNGVTGNIVQGNKIGTDVTGSVALGNGYWGVGIQEAARNSVGGPAAGAGNVISGNSEGGVAILGVNAISDVVQGNLIGTDLTGTKALGNAYSGVYVGDWGVSGDAASDAVIGGCAPGDGNVISANGNWGVWITGAGSKGNVVAGNLIGTDVTGMAALGNAYDGVLIDSGADGNVIGGTTAAAQNVISANGGAGVHISGGSEANVVEGNLIGTSVGGAGALGNIGAGVLIDSGSADNIVGGTAAGAGNTINNNLDGGIALNVAGTGNLVEGNVINANGFGQTAAGLGDGVLLVCSPDSTVSNNTIEFNRDWGINLEDSGQSVLTGNTFQGNGLGNGYSS